MIADNDFKTYIKFPLLYKENLPYVYTYNSKPILSWLIDPKEIDNPQEIVDKINGYSDKEYSEEWTIREDVFVFYGETKMFLLRGWGMLTGSSSYGLNPLQAVKIQNNFGKYIVNNLNRKKEIE